MAFDPLTRILWDTENGEDKYDEINIVKPGFNSGWHKIMGPVSANKVTEKDLISVPGSHYSADNKNELSEIIFGFGFKGITDIQTGPDGYLYILTYLDGKLYRIVSS